MCVCVMVSVPLSELEAINCGSEDLTTPHHRSAHDESIIKTFKHALTTRWCLYKFPTPSLAEAKHTLPETFKELKVETRSSLLVSLAIPVQGLPPHPSVYLQPILDGRHVHAATVCVAQTGKLIAQHTITKQEPVQALRQLAHSRRAQQRCPLNFCFLQRSESQLPPKRDVKIQHTDSSWM